MLSQVILVALASASQPRAGGPWNRRGPSNLFDDANGKGESGTLANAASPKANPNLIYAGGHNNGASSGILKSTDAGFTWSRNSNGLWDTRIFGVWVHPDDPQGGHVLAGTGTGIYESNDGAASWQLVKETVSFGTVMSFREGTIKGKQYILANTQNGIATVLLSGGQWQVNKAPGGIAQNAYISTVTNTAGETEVLTCIGGWGGGALYYGSFDSPTKMKWEGPLAVNKTAIDCANAAVDPNDRNHFIYSEGGSFNSYWESFDGGKTAFKNPNHNTGVFFVMIDTTGLIYTATQAGAFVTEDKGKTFQPLHAVMHDTFSNSTVDRVPHDYQNIVPEFRGDNVAFPSDQGLHIRNPNGSYDLLNAIGDMTNTIQMSALISPSKDGTSRNIVSNSWDWNVAWSTSDGDEWIEWTKEEKSAMWVGEGGGGTSMGKSGNQVMFHHDTYGATSDGGHNWSQKQAAKGSNIGSGFTYVRKAGSRVEPTGECYVLMSAPAPSSNAGKSLKELEHEAHVSEKKRLNDYSVGMASDEERAVANGAGNKVWLASSEDFGLTFTWTVPMADAFQPGSLYINPTDATTLYGITTNCLATSSDKGKTWSACMTGTGLEGPFSQLVIKDSKTMFMMRAGQVPLRTTDGGSTWKPLTNTAPLFVGGATFTASLSWTGNTLVIHGSDRSAIGRQEYGSFVWKSTDDGETFTDETGDLVTISLGAGVWYENDFYLTSGGEGILVKRNFEPKSANVTTF